ncbi:MAG: aldose epimerase [Micrococcales bacterium]|nr:aldose epimerase [Micrococcales bacterium]
MADKPNDLALENAYWRVGVRPEAGAALTYGQVVSDAGPLDLLSPTSFLGRVTGSFPLIPWSNRIGGGLLDFAGQRFQLRLDDDRGATAIHGVVRDYPWVLRGADGFGCQLGFDSRGLVGVNWPWAFGAEVTYRLDGPRFEVVTELTNLDYSPWPAGLGHHPYFNRRLVPEAEDEVVVQILCNQAYQLVDCLALAPPVPVPPELDFRTARSFGDEVALDDCLTSRAPGNLAATLSYPKSGVEIAMEADPILGCMVLYVPQDESGVFALEAVTNCNNAFALAARGMAGTGVFLLEPGQTVRATWSMTVSTVQ